MEFGLKRTSGLAAAALLATGVVWVIGGTYGENRDVNDDWRQVQYGSTDPQKCSPPDRGPKWRGIEIAAPSVIPAGFNRIPVCGRWLIDAVRLRGQDQIAVDVVALSTGRHFSAFFPVSTPPENPAPLPPQIKPPSPALLDGVAIGRYFAVDLRTLIPGLQGTVEVSASYAGHHSNTVRVNIAAKGS